MPNKTPKLNSEIPDQDVPTKASFSLNLSTFFVDDDGDLLGYHVKTTSGLEQLPAWLSFDNKTGLLSGTPIKTDVANIDLTVMAYDDLNSIVSDDFRLTVTHENVEPVLVTSLADQLLDPRNNYSFNVASAFADPDTDALTYTASIESLKVGAVSTITFESGLDPLTTLTLSFEPNSDRQPIEVKGTETDGTVRGLTDTLENKLAGIADYVINSPLNQLTITSTAVGDQVESLNASISFDRLPALYSIDNQPGKSLPDWLNMNSATGQLTLAPLESSPYSLTSTFLPGANHLYEVESNDILSTANDITSGSTITGQLSTLSDSDVYKLAVTGAGSLKLQLDVPTSSADRDFFSLSLFDSTGVPLTQFDSTGAAIALPPFKTGADKTYLVDVPKTGAYYIAVQAEAYDSGQYDLTSTYLAESKHLVESGSNDTSSTANVITSGSTVTGTLSTVSDVDYYALEVFGAGILSLQFDVPTDANNKGYFNLSLYDSAGTVLSQFNTGADNTYTVGIPGTGHYYLGVSGGEYLYESQEGTYQVDITATDPSGLSIAEPESFNLVLWAVDTEKVNKEPILITAIPDQVINSAIDSPFSLDISTRFSDPDGDQLNYSLAIDSTSYTDPKILNDLADDVLPDWLTFDASSGVFSGDSGQVNVGEINVMVTASDASGSSVSDSFALQIKNMREVMVNPRSTEGISNAVIHFLSEGQQWFDISWLVQSPEGEVFHAQTYSDLGLQMGPVFLANKVMLERRALKADLAFLDNDNAVRVKHEQGSDGSFDIFGQLLNSTGDEIGSAFQINTDSAFDQFSPTITDLPGVGFAVVWQGENENNDFDIYVQRFNANGDIIGRNSINGTDEGDILIGTLFADDIFCFNGQDTIISSLGGDSVYGGAGLDTYVYDKERSFFTIDNNTFPKENDLFVQKLWIISNDSPDFLYDIERIVFSDTKLAVDLEGNAGFVVKLLGVLFGRHKTLDKNLVGQSLSIIDGGKSQNELIASTLKDAGFIDANYSDTNKLHVALVATLWENAVGGSYVPESAKPFVEGLDEGSFSMVELVNAAANTDYNKTAIDLTGLMTSGIEYL
jgi:hypothetical protein